MPDNSLAIGDSSSVTGGADTISLANSCAIPGGMNETLDQEGYWQACEMYLFPGRDPSLKAGTRVNRFPFEGGLWRPRGARCAEPARGVGSKKFLAILALVAGPHLFNRMPHDIGPPQNVLVILARILDLFARAK